MKVGLNFMGAEGLFEGALSPVLETATKADRMGVDLISTCDHLGFNGAVRIRAGRAIAATFVAGQAARDARCSVRWPRHDVPRRRLATGGV